jgi:hypothetical protein
MAILNRDQDSSEQKEMHSVVVPLLATGVTYPVFQAPFQCQVQAVKVAAQGLSGSPTFDLRILRWGAGITGIAGGATTLTVAAIGNSQAPQSFVLAASGSSLLKLEANDTLCIQSGGTDSAVLRTNVTIVVQALQDIKTHFGS